MSGLWVEMRAMMSVFDGLCLPILCVLCDDSEVVLYACYLFFVMGYVMSCGSLGIGSWFCTVF